jgi:PHD and RING finger domain-containing protein 1
LVTFGEQEIGTPDTCDHIFCVGCLREWSRHMNTCPIDRQVFDVILVRACPNGRVIGRIHVRPRPLQVQRAEIILVQYIPICDLCGQHGVDGLMVTCNTCGLLYHQECLIPYLRGDNLEEWLCPICNRIY